MRKRAWFEEGQEVMKLEARVHAWFIVKGVSYGEFHGFLPSTWPMMYAA